MSARHFPRGVPLLCLWLVLAAWPGWAQAQAEASLALVSDYVYRGWSQTDGTPTLQAELNWGLPGGFYLGFWGSGVDFGGGGAHPARVEADLAAGLGGGDEEGLTWDLALLSYQYPASDTDYSYTEGALNLTRGEWGLEATWSPDQWASGGEGGYLGLELGHALGELWSVSAGAGCSFWSRPARLALFGAGSPARTLDWKLGLGRSLWGLDLELGLCGLDARGSRLAEGLGGTRVVAGISRAFPTGE